VTGLDRRCDAGTRRAERWLAEVGEEFRHARLRLALTQREVSHAARVDRADYSRIERGKLGYLSIVRACRIAAVLGLDLWIKAFPGGKSIRDAGHAARLQMLLSFVGKPLSYRIEVPLPAAADRSELRAWDAMVFGLGERTAIEFEARLYDLQAQLRRFQVKLRDDPVDHLLVVVADTRANRRALSEFTDLFVGVPRLRTDTVLKWLRAGRHPPSGVILFDAPREQSSRAQRSEHDLA
jgi:transcriptional regulator with XRE-family HTH domain